MRYSRSRSSSLATRLSADAGSSERVRDLPDDRGVAHRIEPDVRIDRTLLPLDALHELLAGQEVDGVVPTLHRLLERGHEALAEVQNGVRVLNELDVARGELEVVRLCAGGRQVLDVGVGRDLLRRIGDGIEGRDDVRACVVRARAAAAAEHDRTTMRMILVRI